MYAVVKYRTELIEFESIETQPSSVLITPFLEEATFHVIISFQAFFDSIEMRLFESKTERLKFTVVSKNAYTMWPGDIIEFEKEFGPEDMEEVIESIIKEHLKLNRKIRFYLEAINAPDEIFPEWDMETANLTIAEIAQYPEQKSFTVWL